MISGGVAVASNGGMLGECLGANGTATVTGPGSQWNAGSALYVGEFGAGTLNILNGGSVVCTTQQAWIGYSSVTACAVNVDGPGSMWTCQGGSSSWLNVGWGSPALLKITNGGCVNDQNASVADTDIVAVDGLGSQWTNAGYIGVPGDYRYGALSITGGAAVTAASLSLGTVAIDVGRGSSLVLGGGSGAIDPNGGTVRLLAGAGVAAGGADAPISAGTWGASYQALGGTWNAATHQFTVSQVASGTAGTPVTIDKSQEQRILITDPVSGRSVGASFLATTSAVDRDIDGHAAVG